jgi:hypothetical protein
MLRARVIATHDHKSRDAQAHISITSTEMSRYVDRNLSA